MQNNGEKQPEFLLDRKKTLGDKARMAARCYTLAAELINWLNGHYNDVMILEWQPDNEAAVTGMKVKRGKAEVYVIVGSYGLYALETQEEAQELRTRKAVLSDTGKAMETIMRLLDEQETDVQDELLQKQRSSLNDVKFWMDRELSFVGRRFVSLIETPEYPALHIAYDGPDIGRKQKLSWLLVATKDGLLLNRLKADRLVQTYDLTWDTESIKRELYYYYSEQARFVFTTNRTLFNRPFLLRAQEICAMLKMKAEKEGVPLQMLLEEVKREARIAMRPFKKYSDQWGATDVSRFYAAGESAARLYAIEALESENEISDDDIHSVNEECDLGLLS